MKKVYIETNGCAVIRHDTQGYSKYFRLNGWQEVENPDEADTVLVTTCGVMQSTEDFALSSILSLRNRMKEGSELIIGGCLTKINPKRIAEIGPNIKIFGPKEEAKIDEFIQPRIPIKDIFWDGNILREHSLGDPELKYTSDEITELAVANFLKNKLNNPLFVEIYNYITKGRFLWKEQDLFEVKIGEGCVYNCSYCATKNAKGALKSRDSNKILQEFKIGVNEKYPKILLTGDEVGEYGTDKGTDLICLLEMLIPESENSKIALRYMSPASLVRQYKELKPHFESGKLYYFCASFQSGSPSILRLMNRPDNLNDLEQIVSDSDNLNPFVYKHSQMIVGFPGETEEDFQQSLNFMKKSKFDYISIFRYSPRQNTSAFNLEGRIPPDIMEERYARAKNLADEIRKNKLREKTYKALIKLSKS